MAGTKNLKTSFYAKFACSEVDWLDVHTNSEGMRLLKQKTKAIKIDISQLYLNRSTKSGTGNSTH